MLFHFGYLKNVWSNDTAVLHKNKMTYWLHLKKKILATLSLTNAGERKLPATFICLFFTGWRVGTTAFWSIPEPLFLTPVLNGPISAVREGRPRRCLRLGSEPCSLGEGGWSQHSYARNPTPFPLNPPRLKTKHKHIGASSGAVYKRTR